MKNFNKKLLSGMTVLTVIVIVLMMSFSSAEYSDKRTSHKKFGNMDKTYTHTNIENHLSLDYQVVSVHKLFIGLERPKLKSLRFNQNDIIKLIVGTNTNCELNVPAYGINIPLERNTLNEVEFTALRPGTYSYSCNWIRSKKTGLIIVE